MSRPIEALPRPELERRYRRLRSVTVVLAIAAAALLVVTGVQWSTAVSGDAAGGAGQGSSVTGSDSGEGSDAAPAANSLERRIEGDPMAVGDVDAPVVLSEWVDMRCPYCAVYSRETFPILMEEYVETGKVRIEMHDAAFFGEESLRAAAAARAAGEQGRYVEFVQAVFAVAPESGHPELPVDELVALAERAGVKDLERFERDMSSEQLRTAVQKSTDTAQSLGVTGVPFFAVDGQAMSGAQPIEAFRQLLDEAVASAS